MYTTFIPRPTSEMNLFLFGVIILPIIFILILTLEYKEIKFNNVFLNNLLIVSCIVGMLNYSWQILSSYYCLQYKNELKNAIAVSDKPFTMFSFNENSKGYSFFAEQNDIFFRTLIVNPTKEIKTIFIPNPENQDYNKSNNFEFSGTFFDIENNKLKMKYIALNPETRYWNLSAIVDVFNKLSINEEKKDDEFLNILRENDVIFNYKVRENDK